MRVLLISLFSHMPHHVGTELEILQQHIDQQDEVAVLGCQGFLPACFHKTEDTPKACRECVSTRNNAMRLLDVQPTMYSLDEYYTAADRARESDLQLRFDSISDIHDYYVDGFDVGYAALSSTVFLCRDAYLETEPNRALFARMLVAGYRTFCAVREFLKQHQDIDRVYLFNGRFATSRGAFRACQQAGVDVQLHERGSDNSKFMLYDNSLPHDIQRMHDRIVAMWEQASDDDRAACVEYFNDRRQRVEKFWHSHTKAQQQGRLPVEWDKSKRNISIFTSSDDEYVAIGKEWVTPGFDSQSQAIKNLAESLQQRDDHNIQLHIRVHPHLKDVDNRDTRLLYSIDGPRVQLIRPESNVCSYTMLDNSEKVITFGSTIGIEATYWGKPSILAGMNFYRSLGGTYVAHSDEELLQLAMDDLQPKPQEPALQYALYMLNFGQPFQHYQSANFETGSFRGHPLRIATSYAPYGAILPTLTQWYGQNPTLFRSLDTVVRTLGYTPFQAAFDLLEPARKRIRG